MRLSELLTRLDRDKLHDLALRIVPGAQDLEASSWAYNLEFVLGQSGWVEQTILARRPPVTSLLLRLVDAENHVIEVDCARAEIANEVETWCQQVTSGDLANRIPDRSRIYRRMLDAAWRSDSVLDASEIRLLRLLRDELGLLRIEHFLLAHHSSIQPYWRNENSLDEVIQDLLDHGIVYLPEPGKLALPDELVPHVRRSLGVSLSNDAAQRLLQRLDSGSHLKSALEDHELPTSGSKQDRIDRLIQHFVPMTRVVDTMHIHDARELARSLGLPIKGAKEELVNRIVEHFAVSGDLATEEEEEEGPEGKSLSEAGFAELFDGFKGHQLQQLLLAFQLRHSGSKQTRISTLWASPYSESTLLSKLKNPDLDDLLTKSDLVCRGSKADKVRTLLDRFRSPDGAAVHESQASDRGEEDEPSSVEGQSVVAELGELLVGVELSSTSPIRFDPVREHLAERLGVDPSSVAVKWLGDPKNHRNRIGEALRSTPSVLLLLAPLEEGDEVLEAARSRLALSAHTHFVTLLNSEDRPVWTCGCIMSAVETTLVEELGWALPDAEILLVGFPREVEHEHVLDLVKRAERELAVEWMKDDLPAESRVRRGLRRAFGRTDTVVRTKHISDSKNIGNRISEAVGAGCGALVLIVAHEVADATRAEVRRQLSSVREPALAVLIAEAEDGGYAEPEIITADEPT